LCIMYLCFYVCYVYLYVYVYVCICICIYIYIYICVRVCVCVYRSMVVLGVVDGPPYSSNYDYE
jgi:hypothetical protein